MEHNWQHSPLGQELLAHLSARAAEQYRMPQVEIEQLYVKQISQHPQLPGIICQAPSFKQLLKNRHLKALNRQVRKGIYYQLRQYHSDEARQQELLASLSQGIVPEEQAEWCREMAMTHASTRERLPDLAAFTSKLQAWHPAPESILDIGCGLQPLLSPWETVPYLAVDKDPKSVAILESSARQLPRPPLRALPWDIGQDWEKLVKASGRTAFDLALLLKVVPVVLRLKPQWSAILAHTPAPYWVLSGSRQALAKHGDIERRERKVLRQFVAQAGGTIRDELILEAEFVWWVERGEKSE